MPWWFYVFTPFGWLNWYFILTLSVHELGHLAVGLLTGHKITKFKVGLCDPLVQFRIRSILFEFSLDAMGGEVSCDKTVHVSQMGIFLTAMAGPMATLLLATGILFLIPLFGINHETNEWQFFCQMTLLTLSFITYVQGLGGIVRDFKNILVPRTSATK